MSERDALRRLLQSRPGKAMGGEARLDTFRVERCRVHTEVRQIAYLPRAVEVSIGLRSEDVICSVDLLERLLAGVAFMGAGPPQPVVMEVPYKASPR